MTINHGASTRNTLADATADAHDVGSGTAVLQVRDASNVVLVEFPLPNPAFGAASSGTVALLGVPIEVYAVATGTATNFVTRDRNGTQILSGTVTVTGGGGDLTVSSVTIASGQRVGINPFSYSAPV